MNASPGEPRHDPEFYVNYFPTPPRLALWLRRLVPTLMCLLILVTGAIAISMRDPGNGEWSEDEVVLEGVVLAEPWPVIRVRDAAAQSGSGWSTVLIVEFGKIGADRAIRQAGVAGHRARLHGTIIQRDGRRILELAPRRGAIEDLGAAGDIGLSAVPAAIPGGGGAPITIEGEIVDPKCYLGAMRPGQGQVHRSCARVCIAGGIPAGLIAPGTTSADGRPGPDRFCLLLDQSGGPLGLRALPWVGVPVRITGTLEWRDDLAVLRIGDGAITPIE